jgi:hypothetical protein
VTLQRAQVSVEFLELRGFGNGGAVAALVLARDKRSGSAGG